MSSVNKRSMSTVCSPIGMPKAVVHTTKNRLTTARSSSDPGSWATLSTSGRPPAWAIITRVAAVSRSSTVPSAHGIRLIVSGMWR